MRGAGPGTARLGPILPGARIGILGGGQLGRMVAMAARSMGYGVEVLDPAAGCAAAAVVDRVHAAPFDDVVAAAELARRCDVVTLEIEKIPPEVLAAVAQHAPLRPGAGVVELVQHRGRQKRWLADNGFPVGPFRIVESADELAAAVAELGGPCHVKSCTGGYDGRGQARLEPEAPSSRASGADVPTLVVQGETGSPRAAEVWRELGSAACLVERTLPLDAELSVMVARRPGGETSVYPVSFNHHDHGILTWSVSPAELTDARAREACSLGMRIAEQLDVVGLLAVELFVTTEGALLVNELAPRPHNSFHQTERLCATSQFEQLVRAICDLPLGDVTPDTPSAIVNLLGDLWRPDHPPDFAAALTVPSVRLHLYGKGAPRTGRKMGHLSATGKDVASARAAALAAFDRLKGS